MPKGNSWEATTWEELRNTTTLAEVIQALKERERSRLYHKTAYLRKQALIHRAKEAGLDKGL